MKFLLLTVICTVSLFAGSVISRNSINGMGMSGANTALANEIDARFKNYAIQTADMKINLISGYSEDIVDSNDTNLDASILSVTIPIKNNLAPLSVAFTTYSGTTLYDMKNNTYIASVQTFPLVVSAELSKKMYKYGGVLRIGTGYESLSSNGADADYSSVDRKSSGYGVKAEVLKLKKHTVSVGINKTAFSLLPNSIYIANYVDRMTGLDDTSMGIAYTYLNGYGVFTVSLDQQAELVTYSSDETVNMSTSAYGASFKNNFLAVNVGSFNSSSSYVNVKGTSYGASFHAGSGDFAIEIGLLTTSKIKTINGVDISMTGTGFTLAMYF